MFADAVICVPNPFAFPMSVGELCCAPFIENLAPKSTKKATKHFFFLFLNHHQPAEFGSGYSIANPDVVDLNRFPDISKVEWTYSTLEPGDCIYIPSGKL